MKTPAYWILLAFFLVSDTSSCLPGKHFPNWDEKPVLKVYRGGHERDVAPALYQESQISFPQISLAFISY